MASRTRSATPAAAARAEFGATPRPRTTRSAGISPAAVCTAVSEMASTVSPVRTVIPMSRMARATSAPMSGSRVPMTSSAASTTVTDGAPLDERLGQLQPDVAAADHHHPPGRAGPSTSGEQRGGVVEGLHAVDVGQVDARAGRAGGAWRRWPRAAGRSRAGRCGRGRGCGPRPCGPPGRARSPRARCARRCAWPGTPPECGPPGRRGRAPTRRPDRGCRTPSSSSSGPSPGPRSPCREPGGGPGRRPPCRPRLPRSPAGVLPSRRLYGRRAVAPRRARLPASAVATWAPWA